MINESVEVALDTADDGEREFRAKLDFGVDGGEDLVHEAYGVIPVWEESGKTLPREFTSTGETTRGEVGHIPDPYGEPAELDGAGAFLVRPSNLGKLVLK